MRMFRVTLFLSTHNNPISAVITEEDLNALAAEQEIKGVGFRAWHDALCSVLVSSFDMDDFTLLGETVAHVRYVKDILGFTIAEEVARPLLPTL